MRPEMIEGAIRDFLLHELFAAKLPGALAIDDSLFELGLIDSMAVVKTVAFCERSFEVAIPDEELMPENFETVATIAAMVSRVRARRG